MSRRKSGAVFRGRRVPVGQVFRPLGGKRNSSQLEKKEKTQTYYRADEVARRAHMWRHTTCAMVQNELLCCDVLTACGHGKFARDKFTPDKGR